MAIVAFSSNAVFFFRLNTKSPCSAWSEIERESAGKKCNDLQSDLEAGTQVRIFAAVLTLDAGGLLALSAVATGAGGALPQPNSIFQSGHVLLLSAVLVALWR